MTIQRHVYPADQVIHLWANQTQDNARNGSNVSFEGKLLYSYSTVIAQIEDDADGNRWTFLSDPNLTPTTGKHVRASRQATRHHNQFYTPAFANHWQSYSRTPAAMIQAAIDQAAADLQDAFAPRKRATTRADIIAKYDRRRADIAAVLEAFNLPPADMPTIDPATAARYTAEAAEASRKAATLKSTRLAKLQVEDLEAYTEWLTTGAGHYPASYKRHGADQITIRNGEILTSQGARCPLDHAIRALRFWQGRVRGKTSTCAVIAADPYQTNGHKIPLGYFTLDSISADGTVKAGCHTFTAAEISRFISQWNSTLTSQEATRL